MFISGVSFLSLQHPEVYKKLFSRSFLIVYAFVIFSPLLYNSFIELHIALNKNFSNYYMKEQYCQKTPPIGRNCVDMVLLIKKKNL
jgi:hypothetical protein